MKGPRDIPLALWFIGALVVALVVAMPIAAVLAIRAGDDNDGGGGSDAERIIQQVLVAGQGPDTDFIVRLNGLPDDYPSEALRFRDGRLIAAIRSLSPEGLAFIALYETGKRPSEALQVFERALSGDSWEITTASHDIDGAGLRFRSTRGSLEGFITVGRFGRAALTAKDDAPYQIVVTVVDRDKGEEPPDEPDRAFRRGENQPLPPGFPQDRMPLYRSSTVVASAFLKEDDGTAYVLRLVTPDAQEDVITFYQTELARSGWTLDRPFENSSSIELAFTDASRAGSEGTVTAGVFLRETSLTEVTLRFTIGSGQPAARPSPTAPGATPAPRGAP